jgi:class 3 adenylate cyclase
MMSTTAPTRASGTMLLADISGYTAFLQNVSAAHANDSADDARIPDAYAMLSSLLDGIVGRIAPPFALSKLEGDAVFAYATDATELPRGAAMLACLADCYTDFQERLVAAHQIWTCDCGACARGDALDLKFVLHTGSFVIQSIAGREELVGPDVVMAHRLLKSRAAEVAERRSYALVTASAVAWFDIPADGALALSETFEHYAPIDSLVFPLPA